MDQAGHHEIGKALGRITLNTFQSILNILGSVIIVSYLLSSSLCMLVDDFGRSYLISLLLFGSGLSVVLLNTFTNKYKINGGCRLGYVLSSLALLNSDKWKCPGAGDIIAMGDELRTVEWKQRLLEIQGAIICISLINLFIGIIGCRRLLRFVRPVSIAPTLIVLSISILRTNALKMASKCIILSTATAVILLVLYYLNKNKQNDGNNVQQNIVNKLYTGVLGISVVWAACAMLSFTGYIFIQSPARTDASSTVFEYAPPSKIGYPFQWGIPNFETMTPLLPAVVVSTFEILAQYYKRISNTNEFETAPKKHTYNTTIVLESVLNFLCSLFGYSIGISVDYERKTLNIKYESPLILNLHLFIVYFELFLGIVNKFCCIVGGILIMLMGTSCILCAFLAIIPEPVVAVLICIAFFAPLMEGLDIMRIVNMNDRNNLYIFGASIFLGMIIPEWVTNTDLFTEKPEAIGIYLLLTNSFFVTAVVALVMDNLINGTSEEHTNNQCNEIHSKKGQKEHGPNESDNICDCLSPFFV